MDVPTVDIDSDRGQPQLPSPPALGRQVGTFERGTGSVEDRRLLGRVRRAADGRSRTEAGAAMPPGHAGGGRRARAVPARGWQGQHQQPEKDGNQDPPQGTRDRVPHVINSVSSWWPCPGTVRAIAGVFHALNVVRATPCYITV
ncbi:dihydrolipoamide succinyltransferase [Streptomyces laurentii]|uniref:Dihydrolipoamide succinyltransferase n=1 Tax=Streptomyces laurentii TaxID=39478 RepID=A0A160P1C0_STRLU|nr:dihydrolipoamide succinyltransferase [Streptomyces laurentii]